MQAATKSVNVRALQVKYVAGLTIIALLALANFFAFSGLVEAEQATAAIINIGGRQRMLTQKVALLSLRLTDTDDGEVRNVIRTEMRHTISQMEAAHLGLLYGNPDLGLPGNLSPGVREMLFDPPYSINDQLTAYLREVMILANVPDDELLSQGYRQARIVASSAELVDYMNQLVNRLQGESEARQRKINGMGAAGLSVMLLVLIFEFLFIFQPAARAISREAEQLAAANAELTRLSNVDGLTGVANRRLFDDFFVAEWQRAVRAKQSLTVIMADVDHFKLFNDTYGHQAGDECLRQVASALSGGIQRATDLVARYGGEEFAVILPDIDAGGAATVAERLRAAVEGLGIPHAASPVGPVVTISLGAATVRPDAGGMPLAVIAQADMALYRAKQQGRNRVVLEADRQDNKPKEGKQWIRKNS